MSTEIITNFLEKGTPSLSQRERVIKLCKKIGRSVLPEPLIRIAKKVVYKEPHLPFKDPYAVSFCVANSTPINAEFYIDNPSDLHRVVLSDREDGFREKIFETLSRKGPKITFWDIGAAQGLYTITSAQLVDNVVAIDPDPINYNSLRKNVELNKKRFRGQVTSINKAVGEKEGSLILNIDNDGVYAPSLKRTIRGLDNQISVDVATVDNLIENGVISAPKIVKIDVEGAEGMVLRGMEKTLKSANKPSDLFIEFHPHYLPLFNEDFCKITKYVQGFGYEAKEAWRRENCVFIHFEAIKA